MVAEWLSMAVVMAAWGGYPLIIRATGVSGPIGALILTLSGLVPIAIATAWQGEWVRPALPDLVRLVIGGLIMGVGTIAFNFIVNSRKIEASIAIPAMDTGMLIVTALGAIYAYSEPVTARKVVGIVLLVIGIFVLRPG